MLFATDGGLSCRSKYLTITILEDLMVRRTIIILVAVCVPAFSDFSYEQTAKLTGGMMAGMMKVAGTELKGESR